MLFSIILFIFFTHLDEFYQTIYHLKKIYLIYLYGLSTQDNLTNNKPEQQDVSTTTI